MPDFELIDLYDAERRPLGKTIQREGARLGKGEFMLYALAVIENQDGRVLITQRALDKHWAPGAWEMPGGGVLSGETPRQAVEREVREEVGLDARGHVGKPVYGYVNEDPGGDNYVTDIYHLRLSFSASDVQVQKSEVEGFALATWDEIDALGKQGNFLHYERLCEARSREDPMTSDATRDLIFPRPVFVPKIWGGRKLQTEFGYDIPAGPVGECWAISAHPNGDCAIEGGAWDGRLLSELWREEPQLFGGAKGDRFPLLIKILDSADWLSVQVHPDDAYAGTHENGSLGKSECWYVLEADPDARVMIGQRAHSREEFSALVAERRWSELLNEVPVKAGNFFAITPGTVHAFKGALVLETQQSSDLTYRVYDFDRTQPDGTKRELHMAKALDVIRWDAPLLSSGEITVPERNGVTHLMSCTYFDVWRVRVSGEKTLADEDGWPFLCVSVVAGEGGMVRAGEGPVHELVKGSHFVAPAGCGDLVFDGEMELIVSRP